jgi:hypothetical protein
LGATGRTAQLPVIRAEVGDLDGARVPDGALEPSDAGRQFPDGTAERLEAVAVSTQLCLGVFDSAV